MEKEVEKKLVGECTFCKREGPSFSQSKKGINRLAIERPRTEYDIPNRGGPVQEFIYQCSLGYTKCVIPKMYKMLEQASRRNNLNDASDPEFFR